jgi:hypothetical protein
MYNDTNSCYEKTNLASDLDGKPMIRNFTCDYCTPLWNPVNTSCMKGDFFVTWHNDTNSCYSKTGLASDLVGRKGNVTYKLLCDYEGNNILGNILDVNTTIKNLSLLIAKSANLANVFSNMQEVAIKDNGSELLEFRFNFSAYRLNLADLAIKKQAENASKGFIAIKGLSLENETKTLWLDKISNGASVCIKDAEGVGADEISASCNSSNEFVVKCPGFTASYTCEFDASLNKYKISGLRHSAIIELEAFCGDAVCNADETCSSCAADCGLCPSAEIGASGGGGGGTPRGGCIPEWKCSEWTACTDGKQTRTCTNLKAYCPLNKPAEQQNCEMPMPLANATEEAKEIKNETGAAQKIIPATKPGMLGGIIGVIAVMPLGFKISIAGTFLSLIFVLIAAIIFIMLARRKETLEESIEKEEIRSEKEGQGERRSGGVRRQENNEKPEETVK